MKTIFTFLFAVMASTSAMHAAVRTVSNSGFPAQYASISAAITASSNGDTIYIYASAVSYGNVTMAKSLTLIGEVAWPVSPDFAATMGLLTLNAGSQGSKIIGLDFTQKVNVNSDDVVIERCRFLTHSTYNIQVGGTGTRTGLTVQHCHLRTLYLNNMNSALIRNNVFHVQDLYYGWMLNNSDKATVVITNNLFISNVTLTNYSSIGSAVSNAVIINNIFWGASAQPHSSVSGCTFANNITWETSNNTLPVGNVIGPGNLQGVDPQFTDAPDLALNTAYDYALLSTSPGALAGSDGTDIGIFGGSLPWPDNNIGLPRLPRVTSFTATSTVIPVGSSVEVQVEGTKVD